MLVGARLPLSAWTLPTADRIHRKKSRLGRESGELSWPRIESKNACVSMGEGQGGRRDLAIIEAKLTALQESRKSPEKGRGLFDHRNIVVELGLGPRAPNPGLSFLHLLQVC